MLGLSMGIGIGSNVAAQSGGGGTTTIWNSGTSNANWTISGAGNNVGTRSTGSGDALLRANNTHATGDFSITINSAGGGDIEIGVATSSMSTASWAGNGNSSTFAGCAYLQTGALFYNGSQVQTLATYTAGDVIKVSISGGNATFYKNGTQQGTAVSISGQIASPYPVVSTNTTGLQVTADFTNWP